MMDAAGPGAIVRIWSANPAGTLRIYLDGAEQPALEAPMTDLLGGKFAGLPRPISGEYSKGWNLYFPIPYARRCKVTSDKGGFYYHVNYRTYEAGTPVESFSLGQIKTLAARDRETGRPAGRSPRSGRGIRRTSAGIRPGGSGGRERAPGVLRPEGVHPGGGSVERAEPRGRAARRHRQGHLRRRELHRGAAGRLLRQRAGSQRLQHPAAGDDQGRRDVLPLVHAVPGIRRH